MSIKALIDKTINQSEIDYVRIISGNRLDNTNKPYTIKYMDKLINFYETQEEYEKCGKLLDIKNNILNHELNYI